VKKLYGYLIAAIIIGLLPAGVVFASYFNSKQLAPSPSNGNCLITDGSVNSWSSCGSGTLPTPSQTGQILVASSTNFVVGNLIAGSNITINTSTPGQITFSASGSGGSSATTTIFSNATSTGPNFTFSTSTSGTGTLKVTGSGSTVNFALDTSGLQPAGSYVTNSYASSTFPSFSYGTSTYATIASYPTYTYASSTFVSFSYATSTFQPKITLTTTGTSGAATFSSNTLNIPQYQAAGNYITALTGDVSASGPGSAAATLATVNSNVGTFGDATHVLQATVNGKGLITAASSVSITGLISGLTTGRIPYSTSATALTDSAVLLFNGTVFGFNATSSTVGFNIKGTAGTNDIFNVASSSGTSAFVVKSTGSVGINTSTPSSSSKLDINGEAHSEYFPIGTTSAATLTVDWSNGNTQGTVLATSTKLSFTNQQAGGHYVLFVIQDGGSRTMTYSTSSPAIQWPSATAPTLSTATGAIDILNFVCGPTNCYGVSATGFASSTNIQRP